MASSGADSAQAEGRDRSPEGSSMKGIQDDELKSKLARRHRMSNGEQNANCFVRPGRDVVPQEPERQVSDMMSPICTEHEDMEGDDTTSPPGHAAWRSVAEALARAQEERKRPPLRSKRGSQLKDGSGLAEGAAEELAEEQEGSSGVASRRRRSFGKDRAPPTPPVGSGSSQRRGDRKVGVASTAADVAVGVVPTGSPHYAMGTPQVSPTPSRSPSPAPPMPQAAAMKAMACTVAADVSRLKGVMAAAEGEREGELEEEKLEYEWQFEILNSLPRDRAIALVDYLRRNEHERSRAHALVSELQQSKAELERKLQLTRKARGEDPSDHKKHREMPSLHCCRYLWSCCRCSFAVIVMLALALAALALATENNYSQEAQEGLSLSNLVPAIQETAGTIRQNGLATLKTQFGLDLEGFVCPQGGSLVRETTVREISLRETTTREFSQDEFERLQSEHEYVSGIFNKLQGDIDNAIHHGQDMVCWKL